MMRRLLLIPLLLLLGACFGGGAVIPEDRFYRLSGPPAPAQLVTPLVDVLAIAGLQSDDLLRERAILFSEVATPLTVRRYHYHFWTHVPGQLIQEQLLDYLRAAGLAHRVIRYGEEPGADAVIEGYLRRFERQIGNGRPRVVVALELIYRPRSGEGKPLSREYQFEEPAADESMHATVMAFSAATQKIYAAFTSEITAAR